MLIVSISSAANDNKNKQIFILAGQSNMAGRGGVHGGRWDHNVPRDSRPNPSILRLSANDSWVPAHEPLHSDIDVGKTCGVGPGMAFANHILSANTNSVVGLVPCAVGGTKITQWLKGGKLYTQLVNRAKVASSGGGVIKAVLWYQGESDTVRIEDAKAYRRHMERLVMDLRSDLNMPSLLVIQVLLASGDGKFVEVVRAGQRGVKLGNVKMVDAKGLRLEQDHLHLTTISQVHLGIKLARAFHS